MKVGAITGAVNWRNMLKEEYEDISFKEGDVFVVTEETVYEIPLKQEEKYKVVVDSRKLNKNS